MTELGDMEGEIAVATQRGEERRDELKGLGELACNPSGNATAQ